MRDQVLKGHLDTLLLAVLDDQPQHGYAVIQALRAHSGGKIDLPTGTVYPALQRLESQGLVRSGWSTGAGRRRRTYTLTAAGRSALSVQRSAWLDFSSAVTAILGGKPWPAAG